MFLRRLLSLGVLLGLCPMAFADLTADQKVSDFTQLAALYARNYGPYEAKRDVFGFDLYDVNPWLAKVRASKTDLEFYDICVKYVASLRDSHDGFTIASTYEPYLPFSVDVYDGKVLIDGVDRSLLPLSRYPFRVGDELVSVDGKSMADWIQELDPYTVNGASNAVSRARIAANLAIDRYQGWWVTSPLSMGDRTKAAIVVLRQTGATESYEIDWQIYGTPVLGEGPIPSFKTEAKANPRIPNRQRAMNGTRQKGDPEDGRESNPWGLGTLPAEEIAPEIAPAYMEAARALTVALPEDGGSLSPFGSPFPAFDPPTGFRLRLGARSTDFFLSGTFPVGTRTIGYIRIPTMSPSNTTAALNQFVTEIVFLQANTDGLVVDVMANGGGNLCYSQNLVSALIPNPFKGVTYQIRATQFWTNIFSSSLYSAKANNGPQWVQDLYAAYLKEISQAYSETRGMTGPIPICSPAIEASPIRDQNGSVLSYRKPILLLTDNFTLSAAESFAMFLQDEKRATVFGMVTDGGGGNVNSFQAGAFSEGRTRITQSLITRKTPVAVPGFPALNYYDGVGIAPDITADFMTKDNLLEGGAAFVQAFSDAIAQLVDAAAGKP